MINTQKQKKYADTLADIFGVLFILSIALMPFLYIAGFDIFSFQLCKNGADTCADNDKITNMYLFFWLIPLFVGFTSLVLLTIFHKTNETIKKTEEKKYSFVIDEWSLRTLEATEAPIDLIKSLESIRGNKSEKKFDESGLKNNLEKKLGQIRMKEVINTALKYTRRSEKKIDKTKQPNNLSSKVT